MSEPYGQRGGFHLIKVKTSLSSRGSMTPSGCTD
jgi:hypothetical protein